MPMEQKDVVIILADISGYTRFMIENQTAAVHGQLIISGLIESILAEVDIPLTLQEIEGDAVFLYAARDTSATAWPATIEEVSRKLDRFFHAFLARYAVGVESTPCGCAICRNSDKLGLKIVVHVGTALFHSIAGRPQVSGTDVILAHRLLKNSVSDNEYLLMSAPAYAAMGAHIEGEFVRMNETYDGFGTVETHVRPMDASLLAAREALYQLPPDKLDAALATYSGVVNLKHLLSATMTQLRSPIRTFTWRERLAMIGDMLLSPVMLLTEVRRAAETVRTRGRLRTEWASPAPAVSSLVEQRKEGV
jgi:hypothetical protein